MAWQSVHWLKILNEGHWLTDTAWFTYPLFAFWEKAGKKRQLWPCPESDKICSHWKLIPLFCTSLFFKWFCFFYFFSFLSTTFPSLFYFPSFLFLSLSFLRTLSFASVTCTPFSLDIRWPTSTVTARCLHFPHNALRFLATGRGLDCVFVFEPGFVSVVFILQWWPITLLPVFVLFRLITWVMGRVNRINSVQVRPNYAELYKHYPSQLLDCLRCSLMWKDCTK